MMPDYSSDGKYIYFNSYRTGHMQIWRMQSDGTNQEQLTLMIIQIGLHIHHLITNGSHLFYMSDEKQNHLFGKHVQLKLMNIATKQIQVITQFSMEVKALSMSHLGVQIVEK
jgi:Tol biopolymer transport system component